MADEPELSRGDRGEWVTYLQHLLGRAGLSPGDAEGEFGEVTESAVREFQQARGLAPDGFVGATTWERLFDDEFASIVGDVPAEFVQAGAPADLADWSEEQRQAYFVGQAGQDLGGEAPDQLAVAEIAGGDGTTGDEQGSWA